MHTPLLRTLVLGSLIAVLAACSSVDAPTADAELETSQERIFADGVEGPASARPGPAGVCFYSLPNFQGRSLCYRRNAGRSTPPGTLLGIGGIRSTWNDRASSLIISGGWDVLMFADAGYRGRVATAGADSERAVRRLTSDNTMSSFRFFVRESF